MLTIIPTVHRFVAENDLEDFPRMRLSKVAIGTCLRMNFIRIVEAEMVFRSSVNLRFARFSLFRVNVSTLYHINCN